VRPLNITQLTVGPAHVAAGIASLIVLASGLLFPFNVIRA
jgi:hypothetical protein